MQIGNAATRTAVVIAATLACAIMVVAKQPRQSGNGRNAGKKKDDRIERGLAIAPVPLDLNGKDRNLVGLGSYVVNTGLCGDCHTWPNWAPGGNPFQGEPAQVNTAGYMAGGRPFPLDLKIKSRNITPDPTFGLPAGLTFQEYTEAMQKGTDHQNSGRTLQWMPWPVLRNKTDEELRATYEYLRAIPSLPNNY